jgi:cullin-associated NEDD8-dissociated protein 1
LLFLFLGQLDDIDKDYRYMACNDLLSKMAQDGFQLDADNLRNLTRKLLSKVSDQSSEVQGLVVRWCVSYLPLVFLLTMHYSTFFRPGSLGQLTKFVNDNIVDEIIDSLCGHLETKDGKFRDIATLGLKQVITELPSSSGLAKQIGKKLTPRIVKTAADVRFVWAEIGFVCLTSCFG